jgi:PAS domain S-box-containing protein
MQGDGMIRENNEQEKEAILDSLTEHVVYHDQEMRILWANRAACESAHLKREDLLGRYCYEVWAGRRSPCEDCPIIKVRETGQPQMVEKMTPDGRWWFIHGYPVRDGNGHVVGTSEIALDITGRRRAEEALHKAKDESEMRVEERTAELIEVNEQLRKEIAVRKKTEKDLQASKTMLSNTFDALQDLMVVIDKDFRVLMSNWKDLTYLSEKDRQGHPFCYEVFMHRKTPCDPCHAAEVFATGKIKQLEGTNPIDGQVRDIRVFPLFDDEGKVVSVIEHLRDITERKQAEANLQKSHRMIQGLIDATTESILLIDKEGTVLTVNEVGAKRFGRSPNGMIDKNGYDFLPPHVAEERRARCEEVFRTGKPISFVDERSGMTFGSNLYPVFDLDGNVERVAIFAQDLTLQKRSEEALREKEERYRRLFNSGNDAVFVHEMTPNGRPGKFVEVNDIACQRYGYRREEFLNLSPQDLSTAEKVGGIADRVKKLFADRNIVFETVQMTKDGKKIPVEISCHLFDLNQQPTVMSIVRDITDWKRAQEHVQALTQELMRAQESERQMISRELHDRVAQDLSTLKIGLDTLLDNKQEVPYEIEKKVLEYSKTLRKTIGNVRDLAYDLRPPNLDQVGVVETIFWYCQDFAEKTGLNVDFTSAGMGNLSLDFDTEINLYRLVQEGLNNVWKHADAANAKIRLVASSPNIVLRISDDGRGFDVKKRMATFTHGKRMGLRSMEERVKLLGGQLDIRSQPGKGTRISIEVPYKEKKSGTKEKHIGY